jgi:chromosomal replication initiation ATPase DnaA
VAYYEVRRQRPHLSFPEIGRIFNRDHTTAIYGIAKVEDALAWADFLIWAGNPEDQLELFREAA